MKDKIIGFISGLLSVVLGIIITFAVQGKVDRLQERKEVRSALVLVRTELEAGVNDINEMTDYLRQEKVAARYFLDNRYKLRHCPADSIDFYGGILFAEASITISHDALELLKNSSLFPSIGDNELSMKIIRAYDSAASIAGYLNSHISVRNGRVEQSVNDRTAGQLTTDGFLDVRKFVATPYGIYFMRLLSEQNDTESYINIQDLQDAIEAIDTYLETHI